MKRLPLWLCFALAALVARAADVPPALVPGFTPVRSLGGIAEYTLAANGLDVLLLEDHSAPVVTFMVTYHVGSRNEVTGTTGATHLLEHMMFRGSQHFNADNGRSFDTMLDRVGGINNASTWLDRTNYYEDLPSSHLKVAVELEADRMRGLLLRERDRRLEMPVVLNEYQRGENDPIEALDKEVTAAAFVAHPYHHPTIGWLSDIEQVPITKLRQYYDTFYWPNNATVTIIGDFQPAQALGLVRQYFGAIPHSPRPIPPMYTEEPPQTGPRRVVVKRPGEVGAVEIAYKAPRALDPDEAPLEVLAAILSDGKTSRLYHALIDPNLAISADAEEGFFHDPSLFTITALLAPGVTQEKVEQTIVAQIHALKQKGVSAAEVTRAIHQLLAENAYARDGSYAIAEQINECIAVGDWTWYVTGLDRIKAVTAADVDRVARKYLNTDQSTTGWFVPLPPAGAAPRVKPGAAARRPNFRHAPADPGTAPGAPAAGPAPAPAPASALIAPRVHRRTIDGVDVATLRTSIHDVVTFRGALSAGDVFNPRGNAAIADLTAEMLNKGTLQHDKYALAGLLESVGATIEFGTTSHTLEFAGQCLRQDLPLVLGLLAEQLRSPRFDPAEFAKLKTQLIGRRRRAMEDTNYRARIAFERAIFPPGHPNRPPSDQQYLADVGAATLAEVKAFHAAYYGPAGAHLVLVGDVDDAVVDRTLARAFAGWTGGRPLPAATPAPLPARAATREVEMPGKTSVTFIIGQPSGLRYTDPGYQALHMATAILGSNFFTARLLAVVRNRDGLTYGIGARMSGDTFNDGGWYIEGTFAPKLLARGAAATRRQLEEFCAHGVTAAELRHFKRTLTGSYQVALSTTDGLAAALLHALQRGEGPGWIDEYPHRLDALTLDQVNAAIRRHLHPDRMITVEAGTLPR